MTRATTAANSTVRRKWEFFSLVLIAHLLIKLSFRKRYKYVRYLTRMENILRFLPQLHQTGMFDNMKDTEIEAFLYEAGAYLRYYKEDTLVLRQGDTYTKCAVVSEGICVSEMTD